jgi:hypothetical protein
MDIRLGKTCDRCGQTYSGDVYIGRKLVKGQCPCTWKRVLDPDVKKLLARIEQLEARVAELEEER